MDTNASFLKYELASTIEQAVRCAVETVLKETARVVGTKLSAAHNAAAESHRENQSLKERLEISESELKAVRYYMTAAEKNIKQCLLLNSQPLSDVLNTDHSHTNDSSFIVATTTDPVPSIFGRDNSRDSVKSFRSSSRRTQMSSMSLPSVGLCLPTVQSEFSRGRPNRRFRSTSFANPSQTSHSRTIHEPELQAPEHLLLRTGEDSDNQFYITDEGVVDKEYKGGQRKDATGRIQPDQEVGVPQEESEMAKFEFEIGAVAGDVNELGLIQVLEDGEEVKEGTVKIEDDPEEPILESVAPGPSALLANAGTPPLASPQSRKAAERDSSDKVHRCNVCGRGFRRFYCLKTHQRIHTGERPYPCRYCEKRFRHLDSLHKHQRIHTGERPYRCAQCGCCFRELGQLKKHRLTHAAAPAVPNPALTLIPAGQSYTWPHVNTQTLDST